MRSDITRASAFKTVKSGRLTAFNCLFLIDNHTTYSDR